MPSSCCGLGRADCQQQWLWWVCEVYCCGGFLFSTVNTHRQCTSIPWCSYAELCLNVGNAVQNGSITSRQDFAKTRASFIQLLLLWTMEASWESETLQQPRLPASSSSSIMIKQLLSITQRLFQWVWNHHRIIILGIFWNYELSCKYVRVFMNYSGMALEFEWIELCIESIIWLKLSYHIIIIQRPRLLPSLLRPSNIASIMTCEHVATSNVTQQCKTVKLARETSRLCSAVASDQLRLDCTFVEASCK